MKHLGKLEYPTEIFGRLLKTIKWQEDIGGHIRKTIINAADEAILIQQMEIEIERNKEFL